MDFTGPPPPSPPPPTAPTSGDPEELSDPRLDRDFSRLDRVFSRLRDESLGQPMEEEGEEEDWDIIRKPLKTAQDVLEYWDHRLEKVEQLFILFVVVLADCFG